MRLRYPKIPERGMICNMRWILLLGLLITIVAGVIFFSTCTVSYAGNDRGVLDCFTKFMNVLKSNRSSDTAGQECPVLNKRFEYFNDFIIHVKEGIHKDRVLLCDVVLELDEGAQLTVDRIMLRKVIYKTSRSVLDAQATPEARKTLKRHLRTSLVECLGGSVVRGVFFTRFVML